MIRLVPGQIVVYAILKRTHPSNTLASYPERAVPWQNHRQGLPADVALSNDIFHSVLLRLQEVRSPEQSKNEKEKGKHYYYKEMCFNNCLLGKHDAMGYVSTCGGLGWVGLGSS